MREKSAMKRLLISSLFGIVVLAPLALRAAEEGKTEIDGTWQVTSYIDKGKEDAAAVKSEYIAVRAKGVQTITRGGKLWKERRYSVNPKANPKEITWRDPKDGAISAVGIYEIKGDTMKIAAFADETKKTQERPTDFSSSEDKKVITYRRVRERTEIDGTWELTSNNYKGNEEENEVRLKFVVERKRGFQTITKGGKLWTERLFTLNVNATPKQITWRDPKNGKVTGLGIYETHGDTMKVALVADEAKWAQERPKDLNPSEDKIIATYRRVREKTEVDGTWELTSNNYKGKEEDEQVRLKFIVVRANGFQTITKAGKLWAERLFTLNANAAPKEITWRDPKDGKVTALGIYEVNGNTMKVAFFVDETKRAQERPKDFNPTEEKLVATYRRTKR
jgi:uncharacterized protein (TIGR03067 family)